MFIHLKNKLTKFKEISSGSVSIAFAGAAFMLILFIGVTLDFGGASSLQTKLQMSTDSALIAAARELATAIQNGGTIAATVPAATQTVQNFLVGDLQSASLVGPPTVVTDSSGGQSICATTTVTYSTVIMSIVGYTKIPVEDSGCVAISIPPYIDYYIVVDTSQSMGLAATTADQINLFALTPNQPEGACTFGCHTPIDSSHPSNEDIAHNAVPPITLRIDAARTAIQDVITAAQSSPDQGRIRIGLYTMQQNPNTGQNLVTITSPTADYASLLALTNSIDLGTNNPGGSGDSGMTDALSQFNAVIPSNGSGANATTPTNYIFIITDGLTDLCGSGHCTGVIPLSACTPLQAKGTVGVIYTTYLPIYLTPTSTTLDSRYASLVEPYASQIAPSLQACASSSNYYFEASDGPALIAAMNNLFTASTTPLRLTQ